MTNTFYTIEKINGIWRVWKNVESERGFCIGQIYTGKSRKDCLNYCKDNNIKTSRKK